MTNSPPPRSLRLDDLLEHADWLASLARHLVKDSHIAEEVSQEVLLAAQRSAVPVGVGERTWLAGILRNTVRGRFRQEARLRQREERVARKEGVVPGAMESVALIERQRVLLEHVEKLPEKQRSAVLARFYEGLPPVKIAAAEGCPVSTVESRIQRGLESLRGSLDEEYGDRRDWAVWVAPMAGMAPKLQSVGGSLAGIFMVGLLTFLGVQLWPSMQRTKPSSGAGPLGTSSVAAAASAEGSGEVLTEPAAIGAQSTRSPVRVAPTRTPVYVVKDGAAVPGADVAALSPKQAQRYAGETFQMERAFWNEGESVTTDANGIAWMTTPPPFFVMASSTDGAGAAATVVGEDAVEVDLELAHRLTVNVVNAQGDPVSAATAKRLAVVAFIHHETKGDGGMTGPDVFNKEVRHRIRGDSVRFQNPWIGCKIGGEHLGPKTWNRTRIDAVAIDVPGAVEFEPKSVSLSIPSVQEACTR